MSSLLSSVIKLCLDADVTDPRAHMHTHAEPSSAARLCLPADAHMHTFASTSYPQSVYIAVVFFPQTTTAQHSWRQLDKAPETRW